MGGIGGCPNVGGICIGCTMPGFPDKFMPFMNQPPGSLLSPSAVATYGRAIHALRRFTQASLNKEPSWRQRREAKISGYASCTMSGNPTTENNRLRESCQASLPSRELEPRCHRCGRDPKEIGHSVFREPFLVKQSAQITTANDTSGQTILVIEPHSVDARYRALVEQIPAVVFMAYLDKGIGEAYVSPQIEAALGFSQHEWLEDPVRWYEQIYPDDKQRWSTEAAEMFLSGKPLKSAYRVLARDGRVLWFHCEAEMIRKDDGRPWFIHGVGVDITEQKQAEEALQEERNVLSAILDIVGALIVVLDPQGRIVRFNRACEQTTGYSFEEVQRKICLGFVSDAGRSG